MKKVSYRTRVHNQKDELNCIPSYTVEYWRTDTRVPQTVRSTTWATSSLHDAQRTYRRFDRLGCEPILVTTYVAGIEIFPV